MKAIALIPYAMALSILALLFGSLAFWTSLKETSVIGLTKHPADSVSSRVTVGNRAGDSVREFGVLCSGDDETLAMQAAANAKAGGRLVVPAGCTVVINELRLPKILTLVGEGPTSVIRHRVDASAHMLEQLHAGSYTQISNITLDGSFQQNGSDANLSKYASLHLYSGGRLNEATHLIVDRVQFINGKKFDIASYYPSNPYQTYITITNSQFLGGADNGASVSLTGSARIIFTGNVMDFQRQPRGTSMVGRGGLGVFLGDRDDKWFSRGTVMGNHCYNMGGGYGIGCIDFYGGGNDVTIVGNIAVNTFSRAYTVKADARNILIANNVIDGVFRNPENDASTVNAAIAINSGMVPQVGANFVVSGNLVTDTQNVGIAVGATNNLEHPTGQHATVIVSENTVNGCIGGRKVGISIGDSVDSRIFGNTVIDCPGGAVAALKGGIAVLAPRYNATSLRVDNNVLIRSGIVDVAPSYRGRGIWVARNVQASSYAPEDLIAQTVSHEVVAWTPTVLVETEKAAHAVCRIINVPEGESVAVMASSGAHTLTVSEDCENSNLRLAGSVPFLLDSSRANIRFRAVAGVLVEESRTK